jgi:hypothetical protein
MISKRIDGQSAAPAQETRPRAALQRLIPVLLLTPLLACPAGCQTAAPRPSAPLDPNSPTNIAIESKIIHSNVKRFGMNLSGQTFYDSGQMMRDLTFRNPGFEGTIWQTVLTCKFVKTDACADNDEWSLWPADFAKGATYEFFHGAAKGQTGTVATSTPASLTAHQGVWVTFSKLSVHPQAGDFYILHMKMPGTAEGGWRTDIKNGATITTEFKDLAPQSPGKQALRFNASAPGQDASVTSDVDAWQNRSFVQLKGTYTLTFRAKGGGGFNRISATVVRLASKYGNLTYITHDIQLNSTWQDFSFPFKANEDGTFIGPIEVIFSVHGSSALLDDATLTESPNPDNPTAFRNAVFDRLRELHPGILRYMDNGADFGSSIDNLLAPPFARQRAGYSETSKEPGDIAIGLHEFLVLCQAVKAEPWFVVPVAASPKEMRNLVEYFSGPISTPYGAKRAALGQSAPWTSVFPVIHLELGNETWNWNSFAGEGIADPKVYAAHVGETFAATRAAPFFDPAKFDLIMDGWAYVPWWNEQELSINSHADTFDIAPYTFNAFNDSSSPEAIFGAMFAEPEALDSRPTGFVAQNAKLAAASGIKLAVYEVNLGAYEGKVDQAALDSVIPSLGAGLTVADHMFLMLRDDGITSQAVFALPEYENGFHNDLDPSKGHSVKLWGTVVDMGGQTNRVRPTFLATELANSAIADKMLQTVVTGQNPTWDQPENGNLKAKLPGAHFIQSFAFTDGFRSSLVLFNLSRTSALPVTFSGSAAPASHAAIEVGRLTSANLTDTNELAQTVAIKHETLRDFDPAKPYSLPPYSMTVLSWRKP